jgi:adenine-specific DNA-methyltransferase
LKNQEELQAQIEALEARIKKLQSKNLGLVYEEKVESVVEQCKVNIPVLNENTSFQLIKSPDFPNNVIIEGDNYVSLSILNFTHRESFDLIYIDPPYNTGAKNWKYNNDYVDKDDAYRHSKWLSFMQHRLEIAKNLLKKDGVLICAIDENEQAHLTVLLQQMFPFHETHCIAIVHNPRGIQGINFSYTNEFAIFVIPKGQKSIGRRKIEDSEIDFRNLRDNGGQSLRTDARTCFYPIIIEDEKVIGFGDVTESNNHPKRNVKKGKQTYIYPIDPKGIERKWRYARDSVNEIAHLLRVKKVKENFEIELGKDFGTYKTVWQDSRYDANEYGKKLLGEIVPGCDFDYPKSLYTVYDCLYAVIGNRPNAQVLDFFAGSGTTGHAVMQMNKDDGGKRRFILCTNDENNNDGAGGIAQTVCLPRISNVIKGYKNRKGEKISGLMANLFYFETDFVETGDVQKVSDDDKVVLASRVGDMISLRENTLMCEERNDWYQIFSSNEKKLVVYFRENKERLTKALQSLQKFDGERVLYVFSWGKNDSKNIYSENSIRVEDIPEPLIEIYRELNRN